MIRTAEWRICISGIGSPLFLFGVSENTREAVTLFPNAVVFFLTVLKNRGKCGKIN